MSLKNLELPASLLPELYSNHLVEAGGNAKKRTPKKAEEKKLQFLGGNAERIAIVVADEKNPFMSDDHLEWLQKMLLACKLSLGDVAIINLQTKKMTMADIKREFGSRKVVMLGPTAADLELPFNFPMFKVQEHDQCSYLYAPSPAELNEEGQEGKVLKTKLWVSLKQLFNL